MKRKFLLNPTAAGGRAGRAWHRSREALEKRFGPLDLEVATGWDDLRLRARRAAETRYDVVVAMGGDGTVSAAANGLAGTETALAVAPLGTGSDTYRGYAGRADWRDVLETGRVRLVDLGSLETSAGSRHFVNMASAGLAADVVRRRETMPSWLPGILAYGLPALGAVVSLRATALEIDVDGERLDGAYVALFLSKGKFAGGGMRIGAAATPDDGSFALTLVRAEPFWRALPRFPRLYTGRFDDPMFVTRAAKSVAVRGDALWPVEADGEPRGTSPLAARVVPKALRLLSPTGVPHV